MLDVNRFLMEEDGIGVVEVILILAVIIAVVIIFKDRIKEFVQNIFDNVEGDSEGVFS